MRITRDLLHKLARDTAEKYVRRNRSLICIYLTGSLLEDDPLLGGTTDIDLIVVHNSQPPYPREIIQLSDEVHLDIANLPSSDFYQPRKLRRDPWLGTFLCSNPVVLHDTQHWFEFTQASAGAQFTRPDNVLQRARKLAETARQIWANLIAEKTFDSPQILLSYLSSIENAANSVAVLSGAPLTERRFLLNFPERAEAVQSPDLASGLIDLIVPEDFDADRIESWVSSWQESLLASSQVESVHPKLLPPRFLYYTRAVDTLSKKAPYPALWLILRTWTQAVLSLPDSTSQMQSWRDACKQLSLDSASLSNRCSALDSYLDSIEEILDSFASKYGV
jgi:hypothetical protein